jgi:hypothetical protein
MLNQPNLFTPYNGEIRMNPNRKTKMIILLTLGVLFLAINIYNFFEKEGSIQDFQSFNKEQPTLSDLSIIINSPEENENFESDSPYFELIISDSNINTTWYTLNYGPSYVFISSSGKINQTEWDSQYTGKVIISFYGNDTAGDTTIQEVIVWKCIYPFYAEYERIWGGSAMDWVEDIAYDSKRNVYLAGYTRSYGNGNEDFLLIKFDRFGIFQWYKTWGFAPQNGFTGQDWARAIAIDSNDNIYIAGKGGYDICVIKYDSSGNEIWSRIWGGSNSEDCSDIAIDDFNNIYVVGTTYSFGAGDGDMCLIKYNSSGYQIWNQTWGGSRKDYGIRIAVYDENNIFVGGQYGYEYGVSHWNIFLSKYNSTGDKLWTSTWGWSSRCDNCLDMVSDSESNIYITTYENHWHYNHLLKYNKSGSLLNEIHISTYYREFYTYIDPFDKLYILPRSDNDVIFWIYNSSCIRETTIQWGGPDEDTAGAFIGIPDENFILATNREISSNNRDIAITFFKDITPIDISIFLPKQNQVFGKIAPFYDVMLTGETHDKLWYSLDYGISKIFCNETGQIDQSLWDDQSNGMVEIMFYANDTDGNICQRNVTIWKTDFPQIYSITSDFIMYNGTTGYTLSWYVYDMDGYADYYRIERNSINVYEGSWSNNSNILFLENQYLRAGVYNYTCFVVDSYGAINYSSILVTILNTDPSIVSTVENFTVNIGTTGFLLSWHVIDVDGNNQSYWIERNSVRIAEGTWNNDTDIEVIESEVLNTGIYNYTCYINDSALAINFSSIFVSVFNSEPIITNNISNFTVNIGITGYTLSWHVYDLEGNTDTYWIERNSVRIAEGTWNNDTNINFFEIESLNLGIYTYICFVNDSSGIISQSIILVKINSVPQYSGIIFPLINTYTLGADYVFNCTWFDIDGIINEVIIEFNNQNYTVLDNFNGEYTFIFKDLSANEIGYEFRWHAMDDDGTWNTTEFQLFTLNKRGVQLLILFNGTQENLIDSYNPILNITVLNLDSTPGNLQLYRDSQLIQQVEGYSLTNISKYLNGVYNITAMLINQNYTGYEMQWLNIQELSPPIIIFDFLEDYIYPIIPEYYHNSININCSIFDSSPIYWVYLCENSSGNFLNRSMISIGNGDWVYDIDISHLNWNDVFYFYFIANDTWGNLCTNDNTTSMYRVEIFDYQNPISIISYVPHANPNMINISTSFTINANDIGSGISLIRYKINDSNWIQYTQPFNFSSYRPDTYEITYYSIDNAGNAEEIKSIIIMLSKPVESSPQETIPSYNLGILIISIVSIILLVKKKGYTVLKIKYGD